ncbi:MAG: metallopeptidase TldD-related protein [Ignavibacteriales bacterium]|nr:metallopeptidase TldD-related protein [Ignavibacteriales bacterium]
MAVGTGMSGRGYEEGMNWTCGKKPGDSILSDLITVVDDPTDMNTFRFGFDMAGMTRSIFPIVEKGKDDEPFLPTWRLQPSMAGNQPPTAAAQASR